MLGLIKVFKILSRKSSCRSPKHFLQKTLNGMSRNTLRDQSLFIAWRRGGGGLPEDFGMKPASNFCFPSRNGHFIMHSPEMDTKISCTPPPPNFFTLHTPIISSVVVCRFFYYTYIHFPSVQSMYKCLKRLQENLDTNQL